MHDTVGSEATEPNTPTSARTAAISAGQSPPSPSAIARPVTILAGSCRANGLRHGDNTRRRFRVHATGPNRAVSNRPPACDATPDPAASNRTHGYNPVVFTSKGARRLRTTWS